jgi:L-iditol 2-dehydrogenase
VERGVFLLPQEISYEEGTFIEPLACVLRAQRMIGLKPNETLLILGAGVSGLLHLLLARASGVKRIMVTDVVDFKLKAAQELGAEEAILANQALPVADQVIVATGALSAFQQALKCVDRAGTILCFAATDPGVTLAVPVNDFWRKSIKIMHSYGASPQDLKEAIEIIKKKTIPLSKLITHRLPLDKAGEGFRLAAEARDCIKVIIEPHKNN